MLRSLRPRSVYDVLGAIGCFAALATGGAYAADTIGSSDVIDESLLSQDIKNATIANSDLAANSVGFDKIRANNVFSSDISDGTLTADDVQAGAFVEPCAEGAVSGYAFVDGSPSFSATPGTAGVLHSHNCTGETIRARRAGNGSYEVVFDGQQELNRLATASAQPALASVSVAPAATLVNPAWAPGTIGFTVHVSRHDGVSLDDGFTIVTYG
jgi:hypothetical protein